MERGKEKKGRKKLILTDSDSDTVIEKKNGWDLIL